MPLLINLGSFDGKKFQEKFNTSNFFTRNSYLICPDFPDLELEDIADCVYDADYAQRVRDREEGARDSAKNIPNWATWDELQAIQYWTDNFSDAQVDSIENLHDALIMIKRQNHLLANFSRMIIAIRNKLWADLPDSE